MVNNKGCAIDISWIQTLIVDTGIRAMLDKSATVQLVIGKRNK